MPTQMYNESFVAINKNGQGKKIVLDHITIRQSISFLVLKLLILELTAALFVIFLHSSLKISYIKNSIGDDLALFNVPLFVILVLIKTFIMIVIIIKWLSYYYEISTNEVVFKKGLFVKSKEKFKFDHIGTIDLEQGFFGRYLNFGTIKLYDNARAESFYLYLIHNPHKYMKILEELIPEADQSKKTFRRNLIDTENG